MMTTEMMQTTELDDAQLVAGSLEGKRDAFRQIVERYQTLISSVAYSATGNLSQSEDLAQETFVTAWRKMAELREPAKLRSWLCGIARFLISKEFRRQGREPAHNAAPLEEAHDWPAREAIPSAQAISREEEAILWRSLERIPEGYREPLVLFYREHQSVECVARALELSEDAVKQRLSRGRKLLQEEVQAFVENALGRTAPGQAFSFAVLAVLPAAAGPAAAAGAGMGAKGTAAVKSGFAAWWLALLAPFLGIIAGAAAGCLLVGATTTGRKRQAKMMLQNIVYWMLVLGFAWGGEAATRFLGQHFGWSDQIRFVSMAGFWWFCIGVLCTMNIVIAHRCAASCQQSREPGEIHPPATTPIKPLTLAIVVTGFYVAIFFAPIRIAWGANDRMAAGIVTGIMLALAGWSFSQLREKAGGTVAWWSLSRQLGLAFLSLLAIVNLRLDVWMASAYGVSVGEMHRLQPLWIIPVLTLALLVWLGAGCVLARRKD